MVLYYSGMSYYLMVFEPEAAPKSHAAFLEWFQRQTKWNEGHSYNDPAVTSARLRAWFDDMRLHFPPLNGPFSTEELPEDEGTAADYSIGKQIIYVAFAWSKATEAAQMTMDTAVRHGVGVFDVISNNEEVYLPKDGELICIHRKEPPSLLKKIGALFQKQ